MKDINKWIGSGRIVRDAELKNANGTSFVSFSIAVNTVKKDGDAWVDEANFLDCTLWGKLGEALAEKMTKGREVFVEAEVKQRRWTDDAGKNQSKIGFKVEAIRLGAPPGAKPEPAKEQSFDDDIPPF